MAADDTWDLAQTDAPVVPPPSVAPAAAADPMADYIRRQLALLDAPLPTVQQDTTPAQGGLVGLLGRIGSALAGGQVTDVLSPAQRERAGIRALGDFGTSLMAGSGYYPGKPMFGGLAQGFQGAEASQRGSEEQAAGYLGAQQNWQVLQQKLQLERIKQAMPLLQMQTGANLPNPLLSANTPAVPGTAGGAGKPGGGGLPAVAYGQGGPGASIPVPPEYMPMFEAASKRTGVPVDLLIAQARQESGFNPNTAGGGLMQIQDKTALKPGFGMAGVQSPAILKDPATNINFGADYLAARAKAIGADLNTPQGQALALREYNGGGDPDYAAHVTRYMPAAPQATAGATQPPAPYKVTTTGAVPGPPSGSTTAPAATPPAPGQTPPAAPTTTADATPPAAPGGQQTFEQFQAQHPIAISAADYTVTPPGLAEAKAAQAAAAQQLSLARAGRGGDPNKSLSDYNTATGAVNKLQQDAQAKSLELQQAAQKNALDTQRQLYDAEMQRKQADEKAAADRAAQIALKTQEGEQAIKLANIQGDQQRVTNKEQVINSANLEGLKTAQKEQGESRDVVAQLDGFSAISDGVGQPGWLQTTKLPGSDKTIAETLGQLGMPLSDTGGVQLLRGGINNLVKTLRQGMAMGSLSDRDLNFIERMGPTEWMDQDTRTAAVGYLKQAYQAKQRFTSDVQKEMARGKNYGDAMDTADAKQKPFVPAVPADLTAHWTDRSPEWAQRRIEWAQQNEVRPGTLYHMADGKIMVMKSPRAQQQGQQ